MKFHPKIISKLSIMLLIVSFARIYPQSVVKDLVRNANAIMIVYVAEVNFGKTRSIPPHVWTSAAIVIEKRYSTPHRKFLERPSTKSSILLHDSNREDGFRIQTNVGLERIKRFLVFCTENHGFRLVQNPFSVFQLNENNEIIDIDSFFSDAKLISLKNVEECLNRNN